jgi:TonB family protein
MSPGSIRRLLKRISTVFAVAASLHGAQFDPPTQINTAACDYPLACIRDNIGGDVVVELLIDEQGAVERVSLVQGVNPLLDSIALACGSCFRFAPAREDSVPVAALIQMAIAFDPVRAMRTMSVPFTMTGSVIDEATEKPFVNMPVICRPIRIPGAVSDSFFLALHNAVKGQSVIEGHIVTRTDSAGRFAFTFLYPCSVSVTLQSPFYGFFSRRLTINPDSAVSVACRLTPRRAQMAQDADEYAITVYGRAPFEEKIDLKQRELRLGLTDEISVIIAAHPAVQQMPERASMLLVEGGGVYDNAFYVDDLRLLPPYHYPGHPYADAAGMAMTHLEKVEVITERIGGRYADASGGVVRFIPEPVPLDPGRAKAKKRWLDIMVNTSIRRQDITMSLPAKPASNRYQLSYSHANSGLLGSMSGRLLAFPTGESSLYGPGVPSGYHSIAGIGRTFLAGRKLLLKSFGTLAIDSYAGSAIQQKSLVVPWGYGMVTLGDTSQLGWRISAGGAGQQFFEGKRVWRDAPLKQVDFSTVQVHMKGPDVAGQLVTFEYDGGVEYRQWSGKLENRLSFGPADIQSGEDVIATCRTGLSLHPGVWSMGADLLCRTLIAPFHSAVDPGLWWHGSLRHGSVELSAGLVTFYPDIRGMPDSTLRYTACKALKASGTLRREVGRAAEVTLTPFIRYVDRMPGFYADPALPVWDPKQMSPLYGRGVSATVYLNVNDWWNMQLSGTLARSERLLQAGREMYEWDMPWAVKLFNHLRLFDEHIHLNTRTWVQAGLPYRDIRAGYILKRTPLYARTDVSVSERFPRPDHRFWTNFEVYVDIENVFNANTVSEYWWDSDGKEQPLTLTPIRFNIGGRFGLRL